MGILTTACPDWASGPWASCLRLRKTALRVLLIQPVPIQANAMLEEQPEQRTTEQVEDDITRNIGDEPCNAITNNRTQQRDNEVRDNALKHRKPIMQPADNAIHRPTQRT
jgi:hypothetical protein